MSGPEHRHEHRHENDPTGNGIVNHGPEKTPHTDPDRPHGEGAQPPERDKESAERGTKSTERNEKTDGGPGSASEASGPAPAPGTEASGPAPAPGTGASGPAAAAEASEPAPAVAEAPDTASAAAEASQKAPGAGDDDLAGTLTDLFGGGRAAPAAEALNEVALRRMLHGAVGELEPSEGTLDHLHRAVPARRARRRQAVVGAAAAALLIGTAVPAFVHVAASDGPSTARPAIAGHGEQAQGGNGAETGPEKRGEQDVAPTERESQGGVGEPDPSRSPSPGQGADPEGAVTGGGGASDSPRAEMASLPVCDPGQLGVASAGTGAPGADGTVYGSFKIANVSGTDCTVSSNGTVGVTALGAADPLKIDVVQHAAGDAAPGLPDPSQEPGTVLLKPAMAYEVRFAWVPTDTCPTVGPSPSPTPTDGAAGSMSEGSTGQSGTEAQTLGEDGGGTADGSVAVTHTPEMGAPTAETKIPNACSGTIYRTGVLATS